MLQYRPLTLFFLALALCMVARVEAARRRPDPPAPAPAQPTGPMKALVPGDRLLITVAREPDLTKEYLVDEQGQITMTLLGGVTAQGLTPAQFQETLRTKLARYVRAPEVYVSAFQRVAIAGGVQTPGVLDFPKGQEIRLMDAITRAGGFVEAAHKDRVLLLRRAPGQAGPQSLQVDVKNYLRKGKETDNPTLAPNDLIYVDTAGPRKQNLLEKAAPFLRLLL
jgi:polysaccharide export outer membrane protein